VTSTCGHPLLAAYRAHKSGHALNNRLLRKMLEEQACELVDSTGRQPAPRMFTLDWATA
jgi:UDP-3-O-[3-hydroxymyristoyl] N-acetylglucosamine deacetylase